MKASPSPAVAERFTPSTTALILSEIASIVAASSAASGGAEALQAEDSHAAKRPVATRPENVGRARRNLRKDAMDDLQQAQTGPYGIGEGVPNGSAFLLRAGEEVRAQHAQDADRAAANAS
jgi:hypothetical protein